MKSEKKMKKRKSTVNLIRIYMSVRCKYKGKKRNKMIETEPKTQLDWTTRGQ